MFKTIRWKPALSLGILACLAGTLMVGTFMGCGQQTGQDFDRLVIATVVKVDGIAWFEKMREGVRKFAEETGHDAFLLGPAKADAAEQIQIIEGLIAQQVDAICVVPFSVESLEPVLKKARARGIVVISHEASSQVNADLILEAFDNASFGRHLMDHPARSKTADQPVATRCQSEFERRRAGGTNRLTWIGPNRFGPGPVWPAAVSFGPTSLGRSAPVDPRGGRCNAGGHRLRARRSPG